MIGDLQMYNIYNYFYYITLVICFEQKYPSFESNDFHFPVNYPFKQKSRSLMLGSDHTIFTIVASKFFNSCFFNSPRSTNRSYFVSPCLKAAYERASVCYSQRHRCDKTQSWKTEKNKHASLWLRPKSHSLLSWY